MVERSVTALLDKALAGAESGGAARDPAAPFAPVSIGEFVERTRGVKLEAPERIRPTGALTVADSLARLHETRAAILALRPRVERADGRALRFPHPAWGPLDLYQWLLFVAAHEDRHLAQIEALKQSMN